MDNLSVRSERNFHNLAAKPKRMHLLDEPSSYASAMVKSSLSHQMRFTVQVLEEELCAAGNPHVLQIKLLGDDSREPSSWKLFADGACVADGSGVFARECFCEGAEVFLDLCRDAVRAAELHQWSQREYELQSAARGIAGVGGQTYPRNPAITPLVRLSLPDSLIPCLAILPFARSPQQSPTMQRYNTFKRICIAFRAMGAQMPDSYKQLIKSNPDETEIRSFLVDGDQVSVTLRIPDTLRDAAKEEAALRGMSFSAFVRTCMIEELAKKRA